MPAPSTPPPPAPAPPRGGPLSRAAYRLLSTFHRWAESGFGGIAVGGWGFLQASVVPGPTDTVLVPLGIADPERVFRFATWATVGSTLGGLAAFAIGMLAFEEVGRPLLELSGVGERVLAALRTQFDRRGWVLVLLSTISPLSSKVVCLGAGAFGVPLWQFLPALFVGRVTRFATIAVIIRFAGPRMLDALSRRVGVAPQPTPGVPLRPPTPAGRDETTTG